MNKLEFLPLAKNDIQNIANYISNVLKSPSTAKKVVKQIIEETHRICIFPYGSSIYKNSSKLEYEYRISKVKKYLIFYVIDSDKIIISRVLYEKMNISYLLK